MLTSFYVHEKGNEVCITTRSTPASLLFEGLVTEHRTVKWSIGNINTIKAKFIINVSTEGV